MAFQGFNTDDTINLTTELLGYVQTTVSLKRDFEPRAQCFLGAENRMFRATIGPIRKAVSFFGFKLLQHNLKYL